MKSVLQEASTVLGAIEKAWITVGQPEIFSVKILDVGKRGLFGFVKKPAIVSFSYDVRSIKGESKVSNHPRSRSSKVYEQNRLQNREPLKKGQPRPKVIAWSPEYIADIDGWLKESFKHLGIRTTFQLQAAKKILNVNLSNILLKSPDDEKILFVNLSYLIMQFFKKKYKKRFDGYHLILNSKRSTKKDDPKPQKKDN